MKLLITTSLIIFFAISGVFAQNFSFSYDERGNRVARTVVAVALSPEDFDEENTAFIAEEINTDQNQETQITNEINQTQINIYPNPATNVLNINISGTEAGNQSEVYFYTLTGKLVLQQSVSNNTQIDISTLASGVYMLKINSQNYNYQQKIIKQ